MTEAERMEKGLIYDATVNEIMDIQNRYLEVMYDFNATRPSQMEERERLMKKMLGSCGNHCYIEPPFDANWGGKHVFFGEAVYANFNLTMVDDANIYVGDKVMFGPNVVIATANHPILPELRAKGLQYNKEVRIGNNVWIGAGAVVVPGVTIGDNAVIGAGSIVVKDVPANCVAVGNPCRVIREVSERDRVYFYRDEKIDWENMERYLKNDK